MESSTASSSLYVINPATEEVIASLPVDGKEHIHLKYKAATAAQQTWKKVPLQQRIDCIAKFNELIDANNERLALTLTNETGKPIRESHNELNGARQRIGFFVQNSAQYLAEEWINVDGNTREKITYEPLGVIGNISAWNYPYLVGVNVFIPALIAGNAVLYKPSEFASLTGRMVEQLLHEAGIPPAIFQMITGSGVAGEYLLQLPLDGFYFTGSYATGKKIADAIRHRMTPLQLELGGKDPLYVMDDVADIDTVAAAALEGFLYNAGQSCCAVERIYVHHNIHDKFVKEIVKHASLVKMGDPTQPGTTLGPLTRKAQLTFLQDQVADAVMHGGQVVYQSPDVPLKGNYFPVTIIDNANHHMSIMKEESFGPIVGIQSVTSDEEALRLMQDTPYGLTAAIYSNDFERAKNLMDQVDTGTVYWNCCDRVSAGLPWSGRKHSGMGSTLSYHGIRAFTKMKAWHLRP